MGLRFNREGILEYYHDCEACQRYPSKILDEECLMCGYTQQEINDIKNKCDKMNTAYKKVYGQ